VATADAVTFAGGRIDALVRSEGAVLSTRSPEATLFGVGQVRRLLRTPALELLHVVFAPTAPRPALLALVRLESRSDEPLALEYTETWDVPAGEYRVASAAAERRFGGHVLALAEASSATRAMAPEAAPTRGLALDVTLAVPPRARRHLAWAYVAVPEEEDASDLVRALRGEVAEELLRAGRAVSSVEAYRDLGRYPPPR
jgi:hypothetical protein